MITGRDLQPLPFLFMPNTIEDHTRMTFYIDLFDDIQHGATDHREWLRDKLIQFALERDNLNIPIELFKLKP